MKTSDHEQKLNLDSAGQSGIQQAVDHAHSPDRIIVLAILRCEKSACNCMYQFTKFLPFEQLIAAAILIIAIVDQHGFLLEART
jgi:hypothetical protein